MAERCGHGLGYVETLSVRSMYKIDRRGGGPGGVQKSFSRNIPNILALFHVFWVNFLYLNQSVRYKAKGKHLLSQRYTHDLCHGCSAVVPGPS